MSTGRRISHEQGMEVARAFKARMEGTITLWAAGSLRRDEPKIGDVDLVGIVTGRSAAFVDRLTAPGVPWSVANKTLDASTRAVSLVWNREDEGAFGVGLQVFVCPPEGFGWIYMLRTGPADFGKELVNIVRPWGFFFSNGRLCRTVDNAGLFGGSATQAIDTPTEKSLLDALGLPWIPVPERSGFRLRALAQQRDAMKPASREGG